MAVIRFPDGDAIKAEPCVVALGNFDGVHVGHSALLSAAVRIAKEKGLKSAVFTFGDHPEAALGKVLSPSITTTEQKLAFFEKAGIDTVYLCDFTKVRELSSEEFVTDILKDKLHTVHAVCGYNFRFGKGGLGDAAHLYALMDGSVTVLEPVLADGEAVSSTQIRRAVEKGDLESAARMLGRHFFVELPVVHGKELGRTLGVPTINQNFPKGHVVPSNGVYACRVTVSGKEYAGVANVGLRPTVEDTDTVNCETHIIGLSQELYGENVKVSFYKKLRDEKRFATVEELKKQIAVDIERTKKYFGADNV